MRQFLIDFLKELERVIPPPEHCHHALTYGQYGSSEAGWEDRLCLQVNKGGTFHCFFIDAKDFDKSVVEFTNEIADCLSKPMFNEQLGVGLGQYTGS
jgi:hypothetical protein